MQLKSFTMKPTKKMLTERGLSNLGKVQSFVDSECIRHMAPYTPFRTSTLQKSATIGTVIGSGEIKQNTPYARKLYYSPGFNFVGAPMRGAYWFSRMKSDKKDVILRGAKQIAGAV